MITINSKTSPTVVTEAKLASYSKPRLARTSIRGLAQTKMSCVDNRICMDDIDCNGGVCEPVGPVAGFCICDIM